MGLDSPVQMEFDFMRERRATALRAAVGKALIPGMGIVYVSETSNHLTARFDDRTAGYAGNGLFFYQLAVSLYAPVMIGLEIGKSLH